MRLSDSSGLSFTRCEMPVLGFLLRGGFFAMISTPGAVLPIYCTTVPNSGEGRGTLNLNPAGYPHHLLADR
jgi:hypothetical protein